MLFVLYSIAPIFCLIAIGRITKNFFVTADDFWRGAEKITYYLLFPALLINALASVQLTVNLHSIIEPLILATLILGCMLYTAAPCAGNAYILAQQLNGDHELMAGIISTTTIFSMLTIPLILTFF